MVECSGDVIKITRGDTAIIKLTIYTPTGLVYDPEEGDQVVFSVTKEPSKAINKRIILKKNFENKTSTFLEKNIAAEKLVLTILPEDTNFLNGGEYYFTTTLTRKQDGEVQTVNMGKFYILL